MLNFQSTGGRGRGLVALWFVAGGLIIGGAGCSNNGLHLPSVKWPFGKAQTARQNPAASNALIATAPAPPSTTPPAGEVVDSVVASVDGDPITAQDVRTFNPNPSTGPQAIGASADSMPDDPQAKLKALITQELIRDESQKYADKVDDSDVNRFIQNLEERNHLTDEQLRTQLQSQGVPYADFRANIRKQVQAMAMLEHEVRDKINVSDADIEAYYKDHPDEFNVTDEKYRLAQILVAVPTDAKPDQIEAAKKKAEEARKLATKGNDFAELAKQYSDDDSKSKGGELGTFSPSELNDDIAAGIKDVKPGEVSKVIRTKYGFHVIKVEEHAVPGGMALADVKAGIRQKLQADRSKQSMEKWVNQDLVKEHYVETTE